MKGSKSLRILDKYVGRIICFALSVARKLTVRRMSKELKNVLVIEFFEMGAAIMSYPALKYVRDRIPGVNLYCLTLSSMADSWKLVGIIPDRHVYPVRDSNPFQFIISLFSQVIKLRRERIDLIIDLELFTRISAIVSSMIKSKYRAGFFRYELEGLYRGSFLDSRCAFNQNTHISKNFLALTKVAINFLAEYPNHKGSIQPDELVLPSYVSDPEVKQRVIERIKKLCSVVNSSRIICISHDVGENLPMRNYPRHLLVETIKQLLSKYPEYLLLLIGTGNVAASGMVVEKEVGNKRCINFAGETRSLRELFELLKMSEILIANDSGPAHFAAMTGTKTLALFSTDSPFMYGPLGKCVVLYSYFQCSPCIMAYNHKYSRCRDNKCLQAISSEELLGYVTRLMEGTIAYGTVNGLTPYV